MRIHKEWLQDFFTKLPPLEDISEKLSLHSFETECEGDELILDILPNRSSDCLCYWGIAKEISAVCDIPLKRNILEEISPVAPSGEEVSVNINEACDRYMVARIKGIQKAKTPKYIEDRLILSGMRPINPIVDISNYLMLEMGVPTHTFDYRKVKNGISVRYAKDGEVLKTLSEVDVELDSKTPVISDGTGNVLGIAGVKGGKSSGVERDTSEILFEIAHFNPKDIRYSANKHKIITEASTRFIQNPSVHLLPYVMGRAIDLFQEITKGEVVSVTDCYPNPTKRNEVDVSVDQISATIGVPVTQKEVEDAFTKLSLEYSVKNGQFTVISPIERTDIVITQDLIEEYIRFRGYMTIPSVDIGKKDITIDPYVTSEQAILSSAVGHGMTEIKTTSFSKKGVIGVKNSLGASYLRPTLTPCMRDALVKNMANADLLGVTQIKLIEIGVVFGKEGEETHIALGVSTTKRHKGPKGGEVIKDFVKDLESSFGIKLSLKEDKGVWEGILPKSEVSVPKIPISTSTYTPFSRFPFILRDIAIFTPKDVTQDEVQKQLESTAGDLLVRIGIFDVFPKEDKISYAFRLIFQSETRTLVDEEISKQMESIVKSLPESWEVRD